MKLDIVFNKEELIRLKEIVVVQNKLFGEIEIRRNEAKLIPKLRSVTT